MARRRAERLARRRRLASYAVAAEDDLRDLAGRLRSAQAGMVQSIDGRAASEEQRAPRKPHARRRGGRVAQGRARRAARARRALQLAFRPWQMLLRRSRLDARRRRARNRVSRESDALSRRAEALTRELQRTRNASPRRAKRAREALASCSNAQATAAWRSSAVAQRRAGVLARGKAEQELPVV